jgi:S-DNA-T family DNA segregation ATPase FtsK/SpoIIIE
VRTRLELRRPNGAETAVVVTADAGATAGDVADALLRVDPAYGAEPGRATLRLCPPNATEFRSVPRTATLVEAGVRAGSTIAVGPAAERWSEPGTAPALAAARVTVLSGPDAGLELDLPLGSSPVGRGPANDVRLKDQMVSKLHARIVVGAGVEIVDSGSSNGVLVGDGRVARTVLGPEDVVLLGESELQVRRLPQVAASAGAGAVTAFNRSPRVVPRYVERTLPAPRVPEPVKPQKFPLLAFVAPVVMGGAMYAMTRNPLTLMFVALSPLLMAGTWFQRWSGERRRVRDETAAFRTGMDLLVEQVAGEHRREVEVRLAEVPSSGRAVDDALRLSPGLWSHRPDQAGFLTLRAGTGSSTSRTTVEAQARGGADPVLWDEQQAALRGMETVDGVPLVADLRACRSFGVAGADPVAHAVARGLVAQLLSLHSPSELVLAAVTSAASAPRWQWLSWLPHVASPHSPLPAHLASSPAACTAVVTGIEELVAARAAAGGRPSTVPSVVLLVEDDTPAERGRLVRLAEEGAAVGVHVLWCAAVPHQLPAACRSFLVVDGAGARLGSTADGVWSDLACEPMSAEAALALARHLAGVVDAGAPTIDESDLPRAVDYLALTGQELAQDATAALERWYETGSVLDRSGAPPVRRRSDAPLRGLVGQGADGEFVLDLRAQGPHALVGGTTGSGKSEFLQAWVLGMAAAHSPDRVTFLFVDYKGGAAFADCVDLPHCVGLVTDLSPHLVRRALASLRAELRHREHLLAAAGAKDLLAMERAGDPRTPPALVIVIDEFAALVQEVPEFVDGVVDVAQRGRSLGLHLILATQRPAGVIKDNLRANTNLRIALRMADEHDSTDVLGSAMAAQFDPRVPGRGAVRTGPGRLAMFQTGYVGGRSDAAPAAPAVSIETLTFGPGEVWDVPAAVDPGAGSAEGPTDAARLVRTLGAAAQVARVPAPRRPWLPELPTVVPLDLAGTHPDGALPVGLVDVPAEQAQVPFVYRPDEDGSVVAFGTSGAGKSTFLRSVAVSAATARGHVRLYGLDFAGGALSVLDALPQVGSIVPGGDSERVVRIVTDLVALLDARAVAFAAARAATLAEYRTLTGTDEPRVLLLVDGLAAFRDAFEQDTQGMKAVAGFARLLAEGRPLGVHVVMSAERPHALSTSMAASVATRIVMRQSDENAAVQLGIARDALGDDPAAGRAVLAGGTDELQIAVPGGGADIATQAGVIDQIAAALHAAGTPQAPAVRRLEAIIPVASLPDAVGGDPVLGIADSTLEAIGFDRRGTLMVAGMTGSGRTTTLVALAHALRRHLPDAPVYYIGPRRSPAAQAPCWTRTAHRTPEVAELLAEVQPLLDQSADDIPPVTLVVEALTDLAATEVEMPLAAAVRAAKRNGHLVIGEAETTTWASISPPVAELRKARRGLVLQPTQDDGGALMGVTFPRLTTADFPPGRGLYVAAGRMHRVQVPLPPG